MAVLIVKKKMKIIDMTKYQLKEHKRVSYYQKHNRIGFVLINYLYKFRNYEKHNYNRL